MSFIPLVAKQRNCVLATVRLNKVAQNTGHAIDSPREIELAAKLEATTTPKSRCKRLKSPSFLINYSQYWVSARTSIAHSSLIVLQGKFSNYENELQIESGIDSRTNRQHVSIASLRGELSSKLFRKALLTGANVMYTGCTETSSMGLEMLAICLTDLSQHPTCFPARIGSSQKFRYMLNWYDVDESVVQRTREYPTFLLNRFSDGFRLRIFHLRSKSVVVAGPWPVPRPFKIFYFAAVINDQLIVVDQEVL
ncbi:hypothetical protein T07_14424 [Trichinella nelsoni]|uniref:Uncharacterized protein n=1 Tax=Trichinella nelsoni TaxID=6336 RepID=A0A0V0SHR9_9BILA|nr:hypothetical protein T07_14424 [Trichinella nelsoni]